MIVPCADRMDWCQHHLTFSVREKIRDGWTVLSRQCPAGYEVIICTYAPSYTRALTTSPKIARVIAKNVRDATTTTEKKKKKSPEDTIDENGCKPYQEGYLEIVLKCLLPRTRKFGMKIW